MRPIDDDGNLVRVRGRQFYATKKDTVDFLKLILENIPEARMYESKPMALGKLQEITPEGWAAKEMPWLCTLNIMFHNGNWQPLFETYGDNQPKNIRLANAPSTYCSVHSWVKIGESHFEQVGRPIRRPGQGMLNTNNIVDDVWGKKITDKLFRLHSKVFSNKARWINLITGEVEMSVRYHNWCGQDMARLCKEEEDLYLAVNLDYANNEYLGLLPDL